MALRLWTRNAQPKTRKQYVKKHSVSDLREVQAEALRSSSVESSRGYSPRGQSVSDVLVVGAGPAGLMLAVNLARFGVKVDIVDTRSHRTLSGRADGLQPKSIETLRQMRLADHVISQGVKVYDVCFWRSTLSETMHRVRQETHYPPDRVDLLDPYTLLAHQGILEEVFVKDLKEHGVEIRRDTAFMDYTYTSKVAPVQVTCITNDASQTFSTSFVVGCDGAHSTVRKAITGAQLLGTTSEAVWGLIDGHIDTDFPDTSSKAIVYSEEAGSVMIIPRERNLTRIYVELKPESRESTSKDELNLQLVMHRAREIVYPFRLKWKSVEWFGKYQVGQRVSTKFSDDGGRVFICGDASHTHSPKAAQGMNTSMHDSWNLAWKLNLVVRKLAKPELLKTYESERRKVAKELIRFDLGHATAFEEGDSNTLANDIITHSRFISGVGAEYESNMLNQPTERMGGGDLKPGCLPSPAKVTRLADSKTVDLQLDIPMLGQFRIYFFCNSVLVSQPFVNTVCNSAESQESFVGRMGAATNASYTLQPPMAAPSDKIIHPERYTKSSCLFTWALVSSTAEFDFADLPQTLRDSTWTIYLDNIPWADSRASSCMEKWLGGLQGEEVAIAIIRPDGYVGSIRMWEDGTKRNGREAVKWMDEYFEAFLTDTA